MDENSRYFIVAIIVVLFVLFLGQGLEKMQVRPLCDWCYEKMYEEPTEIFQYKICGNCYSELWDRTSADFGIEQKRERLVFIKNMIQDRQRKKAVGMARMEEAFNDQDKK